MPPYTWLRLLLVTTLRNTKSMMHRATADMILKSWLYETTLIGPIAMTTERGLSVMYHVLAPKTVFKATEYLANNRIETNLSATEYKSHLMMRSAFILPYETGSEIKHHIVQCWFHDENVGSGQCTELFSPIGLYTAVSTSTDCGSSL